jgi:hypothetical protein
MDIRPEANQLNQLDLQKEPNHHPMELLELQNMAMPVNATLML